MTSLLENRQSSKKLAENWQNFCVTDSYVIETSVRTSINNLINFKRYVQSLEEKNTAETLLLGKDVSGEENTDILFPILT